MGVSGRVCVVALVAVCLQALCVSVSGLNLRLQRELLRVSSHDAMERCGNAGVSLPAFADHVLGPITSTFRGQCHPEAYQIPHKRAYICKLFPQTAHAPLHSVTTPPGSPSPSTLGRSTTKPVSPSGSPKVKHTPKPGSPSGGSPSASPPVATPTLRRSASLSASHIANPTKLKAEAPTYNALVLIEEHLTLMPITPTFFRDLAAKFGEMPTDERPWLYAVDIAGNMIIAPEKQVPGSEDKVCHGNLIPGATPGRRSAKATPPVHGEEHHTGDFRGVARQGGEIFADPHEDASHHRKWYWNNKSGFSLARVKPHEIEEAMGAIPRERIKKELKKIAGPEIATDNLVATFCLLGNQGLTIPAVHSENETKDHVTPITCPRITPTAGALDSLQIVVFSRKKRNALEIAADAAKDKEKEKEAHGGGHAPPPPPSSSLPPPPPPHEPAHKP